MSQRNKIIVLSVVVLAGFFWSGQALAYTLGETINFNVESGYDAGGRGQAQATLIKVGAKALFYVDDNWWHKAADLQAVSAALDNLANEFDNVIYPRETAVFGSEWNPGIDGESRVVILISEMRNGVGGYFNSADEYQKTQAPTSNQREMLYFNSLYLGAAGDKSYLAHEFHHLINFYQKEKLRGVVEDTWLNEAFSEYAISLCGYNKVYGGSHLESRVNTFRRDPSNSLTEWSDTTNDYGPINLFLQYFASRYGEKILTKIQQSNRVGIAAIDEALADAGHSERFADVFANWLAANYFNDCQLGDGQKYCYLNQLLNFDQFHISPNISGNLPSREGQSVVLADEIKDWSGHWYEMDYVAGQSSLNVEINFQGTSGGVFRLPYAVNYQGGAKSFSILNIDATGRGSVLVAGQNNPIKNIILMPVSQVKQTSFTSGEPLRGFSMTLRLTSANSLPTPTPSSPVPTPTPTTSPTPTPAPVILPNYPDGSLLRARGDYKVYIIKGGFKRWIQSADIFAAYPHLGWLSVIEVAPEILAKYQDAWLVRAAGDTKVYEINGDGTKHWLNMTAEHFFVSGRLWDMVYIINQRELGWYKLGAAVMK